MTAISDAKIRILADCIAIV
jgi:8-oxo-dGTP diphosphatase